MSSRNRVLTLLVLVTLSCVSSAAARDRLGRKVDARLEGEVTCARAYELLGDLAGVRFVFDEGVRLDERVHGDLAGLTLGQSLDLLDLQLGLFRVPHSEGVEIVAPDNQTKRREYEPQAVRTFYLELARVKDVNALLRGVVDVRKTAVNESLNSLTIRDTVSKLALAADLIDDMDVERGMIDFSLDLWLVSPKRAEELREAGGGGSVVPFNRTLPIVRRGGIDVLGQLVVGGMDGERVHLQIDDLGQLQVQVVVQPRLHPESRELSLDMGFQTRIGSVINGNERKAESQVRLGEGDVVLFSGALPVGQGPNGLAERDLLHGPDSENPRELMLLLRPTVKRWPAVSEKNTRLRLIGTDRRIRYPQD